MVPRHRRSPRDQAEVHRYRRSAGRHTTLLSSASPDYRCARLADLFLQSGRAADTLFIIWNPDIPASEALAIAGSFSTMHLASSPRSSTTGAACSSSYGLISRASRWTGFLSSRLCAPSTQTGITEFHARLERAQMDDGDIEASSTGCGRRWRSTKQAASIYRIMEDIIWNLKNGGGQNISAVFAETLARREYNGEGRAHPPLELNGDVVPGVLPQGEPYVAPPRFATPSTWPSFCAVLSSWRRAGHGQDSPRLLRHLRARLPHQGNIHPLHDSRPGPAVDL